jgi:hypothetical protein
MYTMNFILTNTYINIFLIVEFLYFRYDLIRVMLSEVSTDLSLLAIADFSAFIFVLTLF